MPPSRALPSREGITSPSALEEAYIAFILYCNPCVPLTTDPSPLREAFRTPPKSDGKTFSTYTLFTLIRKLESRELKTWAELALQLGVDPPDAEKGQSAQKIQQYAVRLKRWMRAMHVDAFFDYLMGRESEYWTCVPPAEVSPLDIERDGVAAEDDMALRALIPAVKPRRGRRKLDAADEEASSRSRRESPQEGEDGRVQDREPWTAFPDGRGRAFVFPPPPRPPRPPPPPPPLPPPPPPPPGKSAQGGNGAQWLGSDLVQTPLSAYPAAPQSAITPSTRASFWADEPKSAIALTPSGAKPRSVSRRHGAKVVSSAWRSGGLGATGKTRGRPPKRGLESEGPFSAFPTSDGPVFRFPSPVRERPEEVPKSAVPTGSGSGVEPGTSAQATASKTSVAAQAPSTQAQTTVSAQASQTPASTSTQAPAAQPTPAQPASARPLEPLPPLHPPTQPPSQPVRSRSQPAPADPNNPRPAKRSRLSLQVPPRIGGEVRLATPPPAVPPASAVPPAPVMPPALMTVNGQAADVALQNTSKQSKEPKGTGMGPGSFEAFYPPSTTTTNTTRPNNNDAATNASTAAPSSNKITSSSDSMTNSTTTPTPPPNRQRVFFTNPHDRTNKSSVEAFFTSSILSAEWYDPSHRRIPPCSVEEAHAFAQRVIENLLETSESKEKFLINLAALVGGNLMLHKGSLKITRLGEDEKEVRYLVRWELRYGDLVGSWGMEERVKKRRGDKEGGKGGASVDGSAAASVNGSAGTNSAEPSVAHGSVESGNGSGSGDGGEETSVNGDGSNKNNKGEGYWEQRYREMAAALKERDDELARLKQRIIEAVRDV
ncbi:putative ars binding protein [Thermochaetoides thermophila DSM 1495]|uniref:Putative ars binding protein n=1 Tax=Chaetomium thermophilum (strain DSM 1495 / CBS 144.50 / IMI 039719) TaxID=759272 RepID=G0RYM4_CHATD|nr:putative ars binding protein [Thermochaetoides thermophila DSM 1495]EGS24010.1 putative ars binding protein [Thermochaetoides thermophila DSM 1495]